MAGEFVIILALTLLNGVFAMAEMSLVASRKALLQQRAEDGDAGAAKALELANAPDHFLSTVQVGITAVGILAGAFGGATVAEHLETWLNKFPAVAPYSEAISIAVVVVFISYISLVIGELVPKRVALRYAETIASRVARPIDLLARVARPFVALLSGSAKLLLRPLGIQESGSTPVTEEELIMLLSQGRQAGVLAATQHELLQRVFQLGERNVSSIMTPRPDMVWIDLDNPLGENMRIMSGAGHTYFPACRGSVDNVAGILSIKTQWARMVQRQTPNLNVELEAPLYVPETTLIVRLLETFKQSRRHVALVIDEYGGISGLVTINDVFEAIVGDIPSSDVRVEPEFVQRADGSWLIDGSVPMHELKERLAIDELPDEDDGTYNTVAGLIMAQLGRIPHAADAVELAGYRLEVVDMDGRRVDKVLATRLPPASDADDTVIGR